jgi:hypothetical protein
MSLLLLINTNLKRSCGKCKEKTLMCYVPTEVVVVETELAKR